MYSFLKYSFRIFFFFFFKGSRTRQQPRTANAANAHFYDTLTNQGIQRDLALANQIVDNKTFTTAMDILMKDELAKSHIDLDHESVLEQTSK